MESASDLIAKHPSIGQSETCEPISPKWTIETERLVGLLWVRMAQMFTAKWTSGAGAFRAMSGGLAETAKTWCWKLADLSEMQFADGIREVERRAEQAGANGEEYWPPSYAEFRGMALNPSGSTWEQRRVAADQPRALVDAGTVQRGRDAGRAHLDAMRAAVGLSTKQDQDQGNQNHEATA